MNGLNIKCQLKLSDLPFWVHGLAIIGTIMIAVFFLALFLIYHDENVWKGMAVSHEFHEPIYHEKIIVNSIFRTRVNTWSNLCYVLVGFYAVSIAIHDWKVRRSLDAGYLASTPIQSVFFGAACIYVGLGSGFFHASLTRLGQQADVGGMYAVLVAIISLCVGSWFPFITNAKKRLRYPTWPILILLGTALCVYFFVYKWAFPFGLIAKPCFIVLLIFAVTGILSREKQLCIYLLITGIVFFVAGLWIRQIDIEGTFSNPDSIWQAHSIWHLLSGLSLVCMYFYFRSENRNNTYKSKGRAGIQTCQEE